jgi:hypothetical protein
LRSVRPNTKKKSEEGIHQQYRKSQTLINNNSSSNNNNIAMIPGNNVKVLRTSLRSSFHGNTNENECNQEAYAEKSKR